MTPRASPVAEAVEPAGEVLSPASATRERAVRKTSKLADIKRRRGKQHGRGWRKVRVEFGRIVALYYGAATSYQIHEHIRCLCF